MIFLLVKIGMITLLDSITLLNRDVFIIKVI